MRDGRVAGDDEIAMRHHRRGIDESVGPGVEVRPEPLDPHAFWQGVELFLAVALLERDEPDAWNGGKRRQRR